jgi:hypothetical protein
MLYADTTIMNSTLPLLMAAGWRRLLSALSPELCYARAAID